MGCIKQLVPGFGRALGYNLCRIISCIERIRFHEDRKTIRDQAILYDEKLEKFFISLNGVLTL